MLFYSEDTQTISWQVFVHFVDDYPRRTLYQNQGISLSTEEKVGTFADNKYPSLQIKISGVSGRFECLLCEIIVRS